MYGNGLVSRILSKNFISVRKARRERPRSRRPESTTEGRDIDIKIGRVL